MIKAGRWQVSRARTVYAALICFFISTASGVSFADGIEWIKKELIDCVIDDKVKEIKSIFSAAANEVYEGGGGDRYAPVTEQLIRGMRPIDASDRTLLHLAIELKRIKLIEFILKINPLINPKTWKKLNELSCSLASQGSTQQLIVFMNIMDNSRRVLEATDSNGLNLLHLAAQSGHTETVRILLEHSFDIEATTQEGYTPLYLASANGHTETVELLLQKLAEISGRQQVALLPHNIHPQPTAPDDLPQPAINQRYEVQFPPTTEL